MFKWKKKTEKKLHNIFTISSDEAQSYLASITDDVHKIMSNDKFMEAFKKVQLPENAGLVEYEKLIKKVAPSKIHGIMQLFTIDCYDNVRRIMACLMATDFEEYKQKSLEAMCEDMATLNIGEVAKLIRFFIH